MTMTFGSKRLFFVSFLCFLSSCDGEIRKFNGLIEAASAYVHYSEGYIVAPGYVDLSQLTFTALGMGWSKNDHHKPDDSGNSKGKDKTKDGDGGGNRLLADAGSSAIDFALFLEPASCANTRYGCNWTDFGVGAVKDDGLRWCCTQDAVDFGYCEGKPSEMGRLIINNTAFPGYHLSITVPGTGDMEPNIRSGLMDITEESGRYVLVIANCDDGGRDVLVGGTYAWKSTHGYLPGDLFGEMYFFRFMTFVYLVLLLWYGFNMRVYEEATIPIQKWIIGTIAMGLLETFFVSGDYFVWNKDGTRFWAAMYAGIALGVIKGGISRCLIVMVSLGWGVVRDSLGRLMQVIILLGILYIGADGALEVLHRIEVTEYETRDIYTNKRYLRTHKITEIFAIVVAIINVLFYLWILDALNGTMQYLENMNQNMKLLRYLRLRCILLFSILFAVVWFVFGMVDRYMEERLFEEQNDWLIDGMPELNYLFVLIAVAVLWRPTSNAKEYAYVMELPSLGMDDDNELEMSANVPSALDDDDEEAEGEGLEGKGGLKSPNASGEMTNNGSEA